MNNTSQKDLALLNLDTDSITVAKADNSPFTEEESTALLNELNSLYPENIKWEPDGKFETVIVLAGKNYVLYEPTAKKPLTLKGSSIKSPTLELAVREFMQEIIWTIIKEEFKVKEIYDKYVAEILNVTDIRRWGARKTISQKTLTGDITTAQKIREAIHGTDYREGDRIWVYFRRDGTLGLCETFNHDYDPSVLLKKLYSCLKRFEVVIDISEFLNYSLVKNQKLLGIHVEKPKKPRVTKPKNVVTELLEIESEWGDNE